MVSFKLGMLNFYNAEILKFAAIRFSVFICRTLSVQFKFEPSFLVLTYYIRFIILLIPNC